MPLNAERLKQLRTQLGLTQRELSHRCGLGDLQVWRYENDGVDPTGDILGKLAQELGVSADFLLGLSDVPNPEGMKELRPDQRQLLAAYDLGDAVTLLELIATHLREQSLRS